METGVERAIKQKRQAFLKKVLALLSNHYEFFVFCFVLLLF